MNGGEVAPTPAQGLPRWRVVAAIAVAVVVDLLQLPLTLAMLASAASVVGLGAVAPEEAIDVGLDVAAAVATTALLGFHWLLLPTMALEAVPLVAAMPTWTGCVLAVIGLRRRALRAASGTADERTTRSEP